MKRIGIALFTATMTVVSSAASCHDSDAVTAGNTGTWYELRSPSNGPTDTTGWHDIVIHNVQGNVDSIVASPRIGRMISIYGPLGDSVSTSGTPALHIKVGPSPKQ